MASYTFETTPEQEALLTWVVTQGNRQKDLSLTNEEYIVSRLPELLAPYAEAYKQHLRSALAEKFEEVDPAVRAHVIALLGVV